MILINHLNYIQLLRRVYAYYQIDSAIIIVTLFLTGPDRSVYASYVSIVLTLKLHNSSNRYNFEKKLGTY